MRIVIDIQGAQSPSSKNRGVGRYVVEMVKALAELNQNQHEIILVGNSEFCDDKFELFYLFEKRIPVENIKLFSHIFGDVSGISANKNNIKLVEFLREWFIYQLKPDIVWLPNLQEGWLDNSITSVSKYFEFSKTVVTLHDVIPLIYAEEYLRTNIREWYEDKINETKKSDLILTVSNFSKEQICKYLHLQEDKVVVAENSYAKNYFHQPNLPVNNIEFDFLDKDFIIYIGGVDKHKNLDLLFKAYAKFDDIFCSQHPLVMVGGDIEKNKEHILNQAIDYSININNINIIGFQPDEVVNQLYNSCGVFVFPSYSEGFGLPLLEAMAAGAPVLCANAASLPDIVGYDGALFDPFDGDDLYEKIRNVFEDQEFREKLVQNSLHQKDRYSWNLSAKKIIESFENIGLNNNHKSDVNIGYELLPDIINEKFNLRSFDDVDLKKISISLAKNLIGKNNIINLYVDISTLVHYDHATGIQRVVRSILIEFINNILLSEKIKVCPVYSYPGHLNFYQAGFKENKFFVPEDRRPVDFFDGDFLLILDLHPGSLISKKEHITNYQKQGLNIVAVIYDLLPIEFPEYFVEDLSIEFKEWLSVVALCNKVVCISEDVAQKYRKWLQSNQTKKYPQLTVSSFHLGADIENSKPSKGMPEDAQSILNSIQQSNSFLMVGTVEPRKGHRLVLDAFEEIWQDTDRNVCLVIVGKAGWRNEKLISRLEKHQEKGKRLFWLKGISDEFLEKIYSSATCLICASEGEGFGLPLIEAAQKRIPIIARDIEVFREVAKEYAFYFDTTNHIKFKEYIEIWLNLYEQGQHVKSDQMPWLTWKQSAQQLLKAMNLN